ncbi:hypothetical protein LZZ85_12415 [Terrimonas sp. NA20]|uniref:DUF3592 domain-containing protein n=1 Tax=Terrimonas ginsenosidimutans TaxID=2908004 RepID=A0ABS9KRZ3_9BACT|nr:DUF3592 domain-containing protein [Terrimonas ginsenosidimutans]MCG2615094.1 hypothetical protein [Terrimonas ginsenosidimutans]
MKISRFLKKQIKQSLIFLLVAFLLTGAGSLICYLYLYKNSFWIDATGYLLIIFGWLCVLYPLASVHLLIKNKETGRSSAVRKAAHALFFLVYPVWLAALVAGFVELGILSEQRVKKILSSEEVAFSTARVMRIETRRTRGSSRTYAVIEYNTPGEKVQQAIRDERGSYQPGKEIEIRYAQKYPDMFAVVELKY